MPAYILSTEPGSLAYEYSVDLDGVEYTLKFQYNAREGFWYLHRLYDRTGNILASGIKLVAGVPLLLGRNDDGLPAGTLIVVDHAGEFKEDPGADNLGTDFFVVYF